MSLLKPLNYVWFQATCLAVVAGLHLRWRLRGGDSGTGCRWLAAVAVWEGGWAGCSSAAVPRWRSRAPPARAALLCPIMALHRASQWELSRAGPPFVGWCACPLRYVGLVAFCDLDGLAGSGWAAWPGE